LFLCVLCGLSNRHGDGLFTEEKINQNEQIMQNKPNFQKSKMIVTSVTAMTTNNEQRTMNYLKQTQTNPILNGGDSVELAEE
jgi:hypothetical protein